MSEEEVIAMDEFDKFEQKLSRKEAKQDPKLVSCLNPFPLTDFSQHGAVHVRVIFLELAMTVRFDS